jgi:predicted enzyme related to lactoylglutathione lyase
MGSFGISRSTSDDGGNGGGPDKGDDGAVNLPPLKRDREGNIDLDSVPEVIQWFLDFDQRVAIIKHRNVEEVFQWKQEQSRTAGEEVFAFKQAEDRLAIGILQALAEHSSERELHSWISQLLNALDSASRANEAASETYKLDLMSGGSVVREAEKIPSARGRREFLINCWLETLCSAEARVLGWLYKEFYGRPFAP